VFAMEAMWARFLPQYDVLRQLLADGLLGEVVEVAADHGQSFPLDPGHRMYAPELGGGALLTSAYIPSRSRRWCSASWTNSPSTASSPRPGSTPTSPCSHGARTGAGHGCPPRCAPAPPPRPWSAAPSARRACPGPSSPR